MWSDRHASCLCVHTKGAMHANLQSGLLRRSFAAWHIVRCMNHDTQKKQEVQITFIFSLFPARSELIRLDKSCQVKSSSSHVADPALEWALVLWSIQNSVDTLKHASFLTRCFALDCVGSLSCQRENVQRPSRLVENLWLRKWQKTHTHAHTVYFHIATLTCFFSLSPLYSH